MSDPATIKNFQAENARLVALLDANGIEWRLPLALKPATPPSAAPESTPSRLSADQRVSLFRQLFRGRTDVYPVRWESENPVSLAMPQPVQMNGVLGYAINPE
jgi:hypothetical protein